MGNEFLRNREKIQLPKLRSIAKSAPSRDAVDAEYHRELFEELRHLRKEIADEKRIPPYVVFGDLALRQMAFYLPQSEENFLKISGVGGEKLRQYGKIFTDIIRNFAQKNNLLEKDIPGTRPTRPRQPRRVGPTYRETQELVLQKRPIEEIAAARGLAASTIVAHIERLLAAGEKLDLDYLRPSPENFAKIKAAFQKSGGMALTPVWEMLDRDFSYEELRIARLFMKS